MKKQRTFFFSILSVSTLIIFSSFVFGYGPFSLPIHDNDVQINGGAWYYSNEEGYADELGNTDCVPSRVHKGFDFDGTNGDDGTGGITEVYPAAAGVVSYIYGDGLDEPCPNATASYGYGCYVKINHNPDENGIYEYVTLYGHLNKASIVATLNQDVTTDTLIAKVGNSGDSYGAHLHFEVRDTTGTKLDPYNLYNATTNPSPTCCDLPNGCPAEKKAAGDTTTFNCSNANDEDYVWTTCNPRYGSAAPGWTSDGFDNKMTEAVLDAYERNSGNNVVGYAFEDTNDGVYLHEWENVWIQNFKGGEYGENAIILSDTTLSDSTVNNASLIRHGFWDHYGNNDGATCFGAPLGEEMDITDSNLRGYDPYCDVNGDGSTFTDERKDCVEKYCGSTSYESMQRFEYVVFCYESDTEKTTVLKESETGELTEVEDTECPGSSFSAASYSNDDSEDSTSEEESITSSSGTVTSCTRFGYDSCYQYSTSNCFAELSLNYLDSVNDIQWGEVEDANDPYVIGEYQIGWYSAHYAWSGSLSAYLVYYGVSDSEADCGASGCSTGQIYSSPYTLTTVTAPGIASYENVLAYTLVSTGEYCYAYFDGSEPAYGVDSSLETETTNTIYVLNCYDTNDCNAAEHCNKIGLWETWSCQPLEADGESCTADEECQSGHCYETTTGLCYTASASTDTDTDGLSDDEESSLGTDATNSDSDNDGLGDYLEVLAQRSDPTLTDTDGDGVSDLSDLCSETTGSATVDTNGCAVDQMRIMFTLTAHDQNELGPDGGDADGNFGGTVSLDGDVAVVGASGAVGGGGRPGAVYVFRWDGTQWNEEAKLTASDDDGLYTLFGNALAVSDDVIVVGDSGDNIQNLGSGAVDSILYTSGGAAYVYRWDGTNWNEEAKLVPSDLGYYGFGYSVAVSGDVIVVSSIDYALLDHSPSAYVYRWDGIEWQEEDQIILPDAQEYTAYAPYSPVAVKDDTFVIGAPYADSSDATDSGAAYVYRWDGDHWGLESTLTPPSPESDGRFGISVDVDRDIVIAAASGSEKVFFHNRQLGNWVQVGTLGILSYSASLSGDLALIGNQSGSSSMAYRWFGSWIEVTQLSQDDDTAGGDIDGKRLALHGDSAVFIYHNILNPTLDTDRDGVSDDADAFPTDVAETTDTDADGVGDNGDACSATPSWEDANESGCSASQRDTDGDGVVDSADICDDTTDVSTVDEEGCSDEQRDSDSDGVLNDDDDCPNTSRVSGLDYIESNGCAWSDTDTDGDWLSDYEELMTYGETMTTKIYGSDSTTEDYFGFAVAIATDTNTIVVGAPYHDEQGTDSGAAYVYTWNGSNWNETKLLASDGEEGDYFGNAVSISGDAIAVAAYAEDHENTAFSGTATGAVYIYRWDGSEWNEEQKVVGETEAFSTLTFGYSIDLSDDHLIVGDYNAYCIPSGATSAEESGAATVFAWDGSSWNLEQRLTASDCAANDRYGWSVAIDDDVAVVGAYADDDIANGSGSAFVYDYDVSTSTWSLNTKLAPSSLGAASYFGFQVSVSENIVAVGAKGDGVTYPFHYDGTNWNEAEILGNGGVSAALFEDSLFVCPQVALYEWNDSNWESTKELSLSCFQDALALNSFLLLIGDKDSNDGTGAVVIYDRSDPPNTDYSDPDSDNDGLSDGDEVEIYGSDPLDDDTDDDNLQDGWEINGYDADADGIIDIDLLAYGANPLKKDLFVEVDWMLSTGFGGHNHMLKTAAATQVVNTFAAMSTISNPDGTTGVAVHFDTGTYGGGTQIYYNDDLTPVWVEFSTLKSTKFNSNRDGIFKYLIMAHKYNGGCTNNGISRNAATDIVIVMGCTTTQVGTVNEQSNTITRQLRNAVAGW